VAEPPGSYESLNCARQPIVQQRRDQALGALACRRATQARSRSTASTTATAIKAICQPGMPPVTTLCTWGSGGMVVVFGQGTDLVIPPESAEYGPLVDQMWVR
jgi:hypothetical protein